MRLIAHALIRHRASRIPNHPLEQWAVLYSSVLNDSLSSPPHNAFLGLTRVHSLVLQLSWEDLKVKAKAKIEYYKAEEERQTKDVDEAIDLLETASVAELKKLEELHKTVNDMTKQTDNHQHSLENLDMLMSVYDKLVH